MQSHRNQPCAGGLSESLGVLGMSGNAVHGPEDRFLTVCCFEPLTVCSSKGIITYSKNRQRFKIQKSFKPKEGKAFKKQWQIGLNGFHLRW